MFSLFLDLVQGRVAESAMIPFSAFLSRRSSFHSQVPSAVYILTCLHSGEVFLLGIMRKGGRMCVCVTGKRDLQRYYILLTTLRPSYFLSIWEKRWDARSLSTLYQFQLYFYTYIKTEKDRQAGNSRRLTTSSQYIGKAIYPLYLSQCRDMAIERGTCPGGDSEPGSRTALMHTCACVHTFTTPLMGTSTTRIRYIDCFSPPLFPFLFSSLSLSLSLPFPPHLSLRVRVGGRERESGASRDTTRGWPYFAGNGACGSPPPRSPPTHSSSTRCCCHTHCACV
ncbi:hypothetical protein GGS23DRAFT_278719 [Durotheca rogersii]|uniref:uncharacterized protein n=1 Tax=Durotheca rogersii TaxID=419775 RepID=UPI0022202941|nr:uncharacterized protein GGS23DRAFT_278719 [Durotheca rogersii]KAI5866597.1 hypothetical protein GGS23DRAFT_278719 [Durotheca rogersii]